MVASSKLSGCGQRGGGHTGQWQAKSVAPGQDDARADDARASNRRTRVDMSSHDAPCSLNSFFLIRGFNTF